jgi:hypothetical protein
MADVHELRRVTDREVGREMKSLGEALALILDTLEPGERVLGAASGDESGRKRCLAVATSRKLAVADNTRVKQLPYQKMTAVEYSETWRKANLVVRGLGVVADIRGVPQDRARNLHALIQTARTNVMAANQFG